MVDIDLQVTDVGVLTVDIGDVADGKLSVQPVVGLSTPYYWDCSPHAG